MSYQNFSINHQDQYMSSHDCPKASGPVYNPQDQSKRHKDPSISHDARVITHKDQSQTHKDHFLSHLVQSITHNACL